MNEPLHVALLNDSFPPVMDGVANVVCSYAHILRRCGCETLVATPEHPAAQDAYPFPVVRYPSLDTEHLVGYRAGCPFSVKAAERLNAFAPDILHAHCPMASLLLARTVRQSCRAPLVFTYHTKYDIDIRAAVHGLHAQEALIRALVHNISACDEVWTVSRGAGENLRALGYEGAYRVMENGTDMPMGSAPAEDVRAVNDLYGLRRDVPLLLFAGRLRWYKGVRLILEGLAMARAQGFDFQLLLAGDGADQAEMEALAAQLGIGAQCIFAGKISDRGLLRACYTRADLFLFPSTFDTNGLVVREAAAVGLPSLLIRSSCAAEGVTDGVNGILMEENAADLCRKVLSACENREGLCRLGERARSELYLSREDAVRRANERYRALLQERKESPLPEKHDRLGSLTAEMMELHSKMRRLRRE